MKNWILLTLSGLLLSLSTQAQQSWKTVEKAGEGTLKVYYHNQWPYAYTENGEVKGIEIDILRAFATWVETRKDIKVFLEPESFEGFDRVLNKIKETPGCVGAASATITRERQKEVYFTKPYLRNASVLVTKTEVPTLNSYKEFSTRFAGMVALVVPNTTHEEELKKIKAYHFPEMKVKTVETFDEMLKLLNSNDKYFAMLDVLTFWKFITRDKAQLKMHRVATVKNESFGFMLHPDSDWIPLFDEFFTRGFGFTASEDYYDILKKHLGEEVIHSVKE